MGTLRVIDARLQSPKPVVSTQHPEEDLRPAKARCGLDSKHRAFVDKSDPGVRQLYQMNLPRQRGRDSEPVLKVLTQPEGIVNRCMDIPAGDGITDTI